MVNRSAKGIGGLLHIGACDISSMNVVNWNSSRGPFSPFALLGMLHKITEKVKGAPRYEKFAPKDWG